MQPRACECWFGDPASLLGFAMTHLTLNKSSRDEIISLSLDFPFPASDILAQLPQAVSSSEIT